MGYLQKVRLDDSESIVKEYTAGSGISISNQGVISATGGGGVTVDDALSTTSTNPVENRVITNALDGVNTSITNINTQITDIGANKQDKLTAGDNITIDANNVISATTGGAGTVWACGRGSDSTRKFYFSFPTIDRYKAVIVATAYSNQTSMTPTSYFALSSPSATQIAGVSTINQQSGVNYVDYVVIKLP